MMCQCGQSGKILHSFRLCLIEIGCGFELPVPVHTQLWSVITIHPLCVNLFSSTLEPATLSITVTNYKISNTIQMQHALKD